MTDFNKLGANAPRNSRKEQGRVMLADRIVSEKLHWRDRFDGLERLDCLIRQTIPYSTRIDITNIKNYVESLRPTKEIGWSVFRDIPILRPAFDLQFFEYKMPFSEYNKETKEQVGVLMSCYQISKDDLHSEESMTPPSLCFRYLKLLADGRNDLLHHDNLFNKDHYDGMHKELRIRNRSESKKNRLPYLVETLIFQRVDSKENVVWGGCCIIVNEEGEMLTPTMHQPFLPEKTPEKIIMAGKQVCQHFLIPAYLAMSFMHCKNIRMEEQEPSESLSKSYKRRHGRELMRHHTLEIEPMKKVLESEGGVSHNGLRKALHICRGHFATYSPAKPLFGRVTGTFWKPAHIRGDASEGIITKDYAVKTPKV